VNAIDDGSIAVHCRGFALSATVPPEVKVIIEQVGQQQGEEAAADHGKDGKAIAHEVEQYEPTDSAAQQDEQGKGRQHRVEAFEGIGLFLLDQDHQKHDDDDEQENDEVGHDALRMQAAPAWERAPPQPARTAIRMSRSGRGMATTPTTAIIAPPIGSQVIAHLSLARD
jgi:hypothetical protein